MGYEQAGLGFYPSGRRVQGLVFRALGGLGFGV